MPTPPFDIKKVATRYAPLVRFHPEEPYFPSSVPWYLKRTELWHKASPMHARRATTFMQMLKKGQVNPTSLISQRVKRDRSDTKPGAKFRKGTRGSFCLNVPDGQAEARTYLGHLKTAKCYVHLQPGKQAGRWWLAYLFFYPYNGAMTPLFDSSHEGDWEHIRVEVDKQGSKVDRIYMAAHDAEGKWFRRYSTVAPNKVGYRLFNQTTHPIVYSALNSHATYATAGGIDRKSLPDDHTGRGLEWQTWDSLEVLGDWANPPSGQEWLKYSGRWGQQWGRLSHSVASTYGPSGPAFKDWWQDNGF